MKKKATMLTLGMVALVLLFCLVFVVACGGGGSPSSVVKQLHTALEKGDTKKVEELMTPGGAALVVSMMEKAQGTVEKNGKITKTQETINGDKATVKVTYSNGQEADFDLVKVDGKWKVDLNMSK
jgi:hypothetical protein